MDVIKTTKKGYDSVNKLLEESLNKNNEEIDKIYRSYQKDKIAPNTSSSPYGGKVSNKDFVWDEDL